MKKIYTWIVFFCAGIAFGLAIVLFIPGFDARAEFEIKKTASGYDIYKNNKLEFEFTKENTDSLSLYTLKMIHEGD